jgi:ribosomal protein S13
MELHKLITDNISDIMNMEHDLTKKLSKKINENKIEAFEGVRKNNSRLIFGILLSFIIADLIYTMICD